MLIVSCFQNNKNLGLAFEQRQRSERKPLPIGQPRRHSSVTSSRSSPNLITLTGSPGKRERSLSLSAEEERRRSSSNSSRYKTELCRPFEENGTCKYGDKCQFAHGVHELRSLSRHPKYKTELCRTFHTIGFCPYGPRCHFIHNAEERRAAQMAMSGSRISPPSPLIGPPSPPLTEPSSPLPSSLTPPSPSPLSFYNDDSPLGSPINSPLPIPSPSSNNVFTFPTQAQDFSPILSPTMGSPPGVFSPGLELNEEDELDEDENLPPTPPDSYDALASRRRLPVFNRISVPEWICKKLRRYFNVYTQDL